jgi:hypothetical protein
MKPLLPWLILFNFLAVAGVRGNEGLDLFENKIRPVLTESCFGCHSAESGTLEGELSLDNRASVSQGGRSGPIVVAGDPAASRLIQAIEYHDPGLQMPPDGRLPDETIAAFRRWIELGAPDPRDGSAPETGTIATRSVKHWAFQKPHRPEVSPDMSGWSRTPVDQLIVAKLREANLSPSLAADRRTLIKRLYFDLVGLAPTHDAIELFAADNAPDAYEKLVDRLLASPQFGERWARHWLDVARFADTKGYVFTEGRDFPQAFKYRDWVINAFNTDLPIDQFLKLQLAADRLADPNENTANLDAQGFVTLGRRFINNQDDIAADRIDVIFRGLMGLTVACARCHDHKYDPISDEDYYAVCGILQSSREEQDDQHPLRLVDKDHPEDVGVFIRGASHNQGPLVKRGFPTFFANFAHTVENGSGRLELAEAIVHPDNPLTARVFVNRVWGHLFGEHLVTTPSDFGLRCEPPRQQELLDFLATDFVAKGCSLKSLIRDLVISSTYRQSSTPSSELLAADPENFLWGRTNRRRLDFESLRDRLLEVAGQLDTQIGGASENITAGDGGKRRTLYAQIDRQNLPNVFRTFDFASPDAHTPERPHTLVPQQALFMMNDQLVARVAQAILNTTRSSEPHDRISEIYRCVLARNPTDDELQQVDAFLARDKSEELPPDEWSFGFGRITDGQVSFAALPHFAANRWQPRPSFPDGELGYVSVTPTGGHPGRSSEFNSIRRWTAPHGGTLVITGELLRPEQKGDGVEGKVVSSRQGVVAEWTVEQGSQATEARIENVAPGELIDFVVGCRANDAYDSFNWRVTLILENPGERQIWDAERGFHGPAAAPLDLWAQFIQVLLMSNEFLYVD